MSGYSWPLLDARQEHLESRLCSFAALIHRGLAATTLVCQHHFAPTERLHAEALLVSLNSGAAKKYLWECNDRMRAQTAEKTCIERDKWCRSAEQIRTDQRPRMAQDLLSACTSRKRKSRVKGARTSLVTIVRLSQYQHSKWRPQLAGT